MPELLLELFSEEIPARMQAGAARDLARMAGERLKAQELGYDSLRTFVTPRRLTLVVEGLPAAQADRTEERKGPKANAPEQALAGFLRSTGLTREQLVERDGVLFAQIRRTGRPTPEIAAEIVSAVCAEFPWPKSMRSGASGFRWVRPLRSVILLFDGEVVPVEVGGVASGRTTRGHRFMGSLKGAPFEVSGFADYGARLAAQAVTLDAAERRATLLERAQALCAAQGLGLVPDEALADEVAGLVEHPVPLLGAMDPAVLDLPPEVIRTSMRTHQKYFAVRDPKMGRLAPRFVVVANIEASDGGAEIARGNAKVLSARLSDARFFWNEDQKPGAFARWAEKLKGVTFHARLGTMAERVERIAALAREIAPAVGADPKLAETAARLAKLDLASAMVGEFPELQGVMGGYYVRRAPYAGAGGHADATADELLHVAEADGEEDPLATLDQVAPQAEGEWWSGLSREEVDQVADAVRDHYKPLGPGDSVPTAAVTVAVALADKLDTLVGFFAIDEKPTGSKDPYALRRAALGVIRLVLPVRGRIGLAALTSSAMARSLRDWAEQIARDPQQISIDDFTPERAEEMADLQQAAVSLRAATAVDILGSEGEVGGRFQDLLVFFADRLKVQLREEGKRHDLVDAVFALGDDDLVRIVDRVEALSAFLATEDGANLLAGYRRAVNILKAEEKKHPGEVISPLPLADGGEAGRGGVGATIVDQAGEAPPASSVQSRGHTPMPGPSPIDGEGGSSAERDLRAALQQVQAELEPRLSAEDFRGAMASLSRLRGPVDAFFDGVLVNDPDPQVRLSRLRLLAALREQANRVADFSLIQG